MLEAAQIAARAASGDEACTATLARFEKRLARARAAVVNRRGPDGIVFGGGLSRIERLCDRLPRLLAHEVFAAGADEPLRTRILPSAHGDASGVRDAAWLWANREA